MVAVLGRRDPNDALGGAVPANFAQCPPTLFKRSEFEEEMIAGNLK